MPNHDTKTTIARYLEPITTYQSSGLIAQKTTYSEITEAVLQAIYDLITLTDFDAIDRKTLILSAVITIYDALSKFLPLPYKALSPFFRFILTRWIAPRLYDVLTNRANWDVEELQKQHVISEALNAQLKEMS